MPMRSPEHVSAMLQGLKQVEKAEETPLELPDVIRTTEEGQQLENLAQQYNLDMREQLKQLKQSSVDYVKIFLQINSFLQREHTQAADYIAVFELANSIKDRVHTLDSIIQQATRILSTSKDEGIPIDILLQAEGSDLPGENLQQYLERLLFERQILMLYLAALPEDEIERGAEEYAIANPEEKEPFQPRNDFERVLMDSGVPEYLFEAEGGPEILSLRYQMLGDAFYAIILRRIWKDINPNNLNIPNLMSVSIQVTGKDGVSRTYSVKNLMDSILSVPGEERQVASSLYVSLSEKLSFASMLAEERESFLNLGGFEDVGRVFPESAQWFNPSFWSSMSEQDLPFPRFTGAEWTFPETEITEGHQDERAVDLDVGDRAFKELFFQALKNSITRGLYFLGPDGQPIEYDAADTIQNGEYDPQREDVLEKQRISGTPHLYIYRHVDQLGITDHNIPTAYLLNSNRTRTIPRGIYLKNIRFDKQRGGWGGFQPRLTAKKHGQSILQAGRNDMIRRLLPIELRRQLHLTPQQDEEINEKFSERVTENIPDGLFGPTWAANMVELFNLFTLEDAYQDAKSEFGKDPSKENESAHTLHKMMNPSLGVVKYVKESGREGVARMAVISVQAFALAYLDYYIIRGDDGFVGTLRQHIMRSEKFDDVPWKKLPIDITAKWTGHINHMLPIMTSCMKGFGKGSVLQLGEIDWKAGELSKVNAALVAELINVFRKLNTYLIHGFAGTMESDLSLTKQELATASQAGLSKKEYSDLLLASSGQFVRIVVADASNPTREVSTLSRINKFFPIEERELLDWVPEKQRKQLSSGRHFARWQVEQMGTLPNGQAINVSTLRIQVDADEKGELVDPNKLLTQELMARVVAIASAEGDVAKRIKKEDIALLGLIFSKEMRELYRRKYFSSWGDEQITRASLKMIEIFSPGGGWEDLVENELPQITGPDLYTKTQFFQVLARMGVKYTLQEILEAGKSLQKQLADINK